MDKLDDIVRGAARALEGTTPRGTFDELPSRIDARLEGSSMQSQSVPEREENSGLHDIKELATTAKRRMSRRITTQNEAQDALFSQGSGLHAVALPDPAKMVALPTVEEARALAASATGSHGVVAAAAEAPLDDLSVAREARASADRPKKRAGWMYAVGAVAAAAAAVAVYVTTRPGEPQAEGRAAVAKNEAAPAPEAPAPAATGTAAGTSAAAPAVAPEPAPAVETMQADLAQPSDLGIAGDAPGTTDAAEGEAAAPARKVAKEEAKADGAARTKVKPEDDKASGKGKGAGGGGDVVDPAKTKVEPDPKVDAKKAPPPDDKPKDDLDKSIEDLLNSPVEKKKVDKPDKTELTSQELRAGLKAVEGDAKACYGKHGEAGTVKVKLTIDPSGKVTKSSATGTFAGTPSGDCVASALKGATFPAWDGAPMSTSYAVLLSD